MLTFLLYKLRKMLSLLCKKTKQKIESSSVIPNDTIIRVPLETESSVDFDPPGVRVDGGWC